MQMFWRVAASKSREIVSEHILVINQINAQIIIL